MEIVANGAEGQFGTGLCQPLSVCQIDNYTHCPTITVSGGQSQSKEHK